MALKFDGKLTGATHASGANAAGARAFRRQGGLLFVVGQLRIQEHLLRGANGRFLPEVQHRFANANKRLGAQLQADIAAKLEEVRVSSRKGVSSGRLHDAILAPENFQAAPGGAQFGFGVMDFAFLDKSTAKYWRTIEVGTSHFVGQTIRGVWGESLTGQFKVSGANPAPGYPIAGPPYTTFGVNERGRLFPGGAAKGSEARRALRADAYDRLRSSGQTAKAARNGRNAGFQGIIRRPIRPERYAIGAWEEFGMKDKIEQAFVEAFFGSIPSRAAIEFDYGLRGSPPSGRGSKFKGSIG